MTRLPRIGQRKPVNTFPAERHRRTTPAVVAKPGPVSDRDLERPPWLLSNSVSLSGSRWRPLGTRLARLAAGTSVMGLGLTMLLWSRLGLVPLDALHLGVAHAFGWTIGGGIIAVQSVLLLTFLPMRLRPGLGTIAAFLVPAVLVDLLLHRLPPVENLPLRAGALAAGGFLFCFGVALYLSADLGRIPRDGIMLALAGDRPGTPAPPKRVAIFRIVLDAVFVAGGVLLLGPAEAIHIGALGVGTVALTLLSGPAIAACLHFLGGASGPRSRDPGLNSLRPRGSSAALRASPDPTEGSTA